MIQSVLLIYSPLFEEPHEYFMHNSTDETSRKFQTLLNNKSNYIIMRVPTGEYIYPKEFINKHTFIKINHVSIPEGDDKPNNVISLDAMRTL